MKLPSMNDSRGRESRTLFFVTVTWVVVLVKFFLADVDVWLLGEMPAMSGHELASSTIAILGIWLGREWTEKRKQPQGE